MISTDCKVLLRQILSDTNPSGRWSDPTLYNFIDRANKRIVRDVKFPDTRLTFPTVANQGEHQLPFVVILPLRVYVAGQLAVPSDIDTLEGHQIGMYDQTTQGTGTLPANLSAPPGTLGAYEPQWVQQTPLSYPVANSWMTPAPDSQPWYTGQRPRYYLRGGFLGLVPAPSNVVTVCFDCIALPPTVNVDGQVMTTPDLFMDAIVWAAATYAKYADDSGSSHQSRDVAEQTYQARMRELRTWRKTYDQGDGPGGPKPLTYRTRYAGYRNRRNSGGLS